MQLSKVRDSYGYTLVHQCCLFNNYMLLQFLIDFFKQSFKNVLKEFNLKVLNTGEGKAIKKEHIDEKIKQAVLKWIDDATVTDDGWTALHLSCKNNEMVNYLINLGANLHLRNKKGVSMMHKAAMDDNTYLITYLRDVHNFSIDEREKQGNTPLHYAAFYNSQYAAFWLVGFGAEINATNHNLDTPLHLLLKTQKQLENDKMAREFIFKGADRNMKNSWGLRPIDLIKDVPNR